MSMLYKLYLDEGGTPNPKSSFKYFILSGIIVTDEQSNKLKIGADRIKYKYWSDTKISNPLGVVFHSKEIGRRENDFAILKDPAIEARFYKDLFSLFYVSGMKCIVVTIDKEKATVLGWNIKKIYEEAANTLIRFFIEFLNGKGNGRIIIESSGIEKDIFFFKNYIHYLANGVPSLGLSHKETKKLLTSISFVSKNNFDIESQIADLLAYPAGYKCLVEEGKKNFVLNSYEEKMCQILQNKLIKFGLKTSFIQLPKLDTKN